MSLGDRLLQWLHGIWSYAAQQFPLSLILYQLQQIGDAFKNKPPDALQQIIDTIGASPNPASQVLAAGIAAGAGKHLPPAQESILGEARKMIENPSAYLAVKFGEIANTPQIEAGAELLASWINVSVYQPMQALVTQTENDPVLVAREIMVAVQALNLIAHTVGVAAEIIGAGQIEGVTEAMKSAVEMTGLSEVAALATAPLFEVGMRPAAERFYNRLYRPARLAPDQMIIAQALGLIGKDEADSEIAKEGFRDADIEIMRELVYDRIGVGDIFAARDVGMIADPETLSRLLKKRLHVDDAKFLMDLHAEQRNLDWSTRIFQIAVRNYTKYQLNDAGLQRVAQAAGFSQERSDFELNLARMIRASEVTDLQVGQIEAAFKQNIISDVEAANYLAKIQIDPGGIPVLLRTWKAQQAPGVQHLNASELTTAFHDRILTKDQFSDRLRSLGWNPEDTRILVEIAEWQAPVKPRELSEGSIVTAFQREIISHDEAVDLMQSIGFKKEDAAFILRAHTILPSQRQRELGDSEIAKLYELQVIPKENALARFRAKGYSHDDAELLLIALTSKVPKEATTTKPKERHLTKAEIVDAFKKDVLTRGEAIDELVKIGYSTEDADLLLNEAIAPKV